MNDFLQKLAQERRGASREDVWNQWSAAHHHVTGLELWETKGSASVSESIKAFLKMIPDDHYRHGIAIVAPPYLHQRGSLYVPGIALSDIRFLEDPENVRVEAHAIWQQEGAAVRYLRVDRSYSEEGYAMTEAFYVLEDGRIARQRLGLTFPADVEQLYEAMAQYVVRSRL